VSTAASTLQQFLDEVSRLTGLEICLYDLNYFTREAPELRVRQERRIHASPYCVLVKSNDQAWQKCIQTEHWRAQKSMGLKRALIHTCHAGVTELILPLRSGRKLIGSLYLGQTITVSPSELEKIIADLHRKYHFEPAREDFRSTAELLPHRSETELRKYEPLLGCVQAFIERTEELINLRASLAGGERNSETPEGKITMERVPVFFLNELKPPSAQIRQAVGLIAANYWKEFGQERVAREVGLSFSQFSRRFHGETGMSFRTCLMRSRIEAACYLLKRSHYNVSQIAALIGYENASSFQRTFRRVKGVTPHVYIRRQSL